MDLFAVFFGVAVSTFDFRIIEDCVLAACDIDLHQVLVNDAAGTDIKVANFRVTHLSVR